MGDIHTYTCMYVYNTGGKFRDKIEFEFLNPNLRMYFLYE